jgi:hypothetical protein
MWCASIFHLRKVIVTTVLTDCHAPRHTMTVQRQSTKIMGEGAWLRNCR